MLADSTEEILRSHRLLTGPRRDVEELAQLHSVVHSSSTERQTTALVRANGHVYDSHWRVSDVGLEQVVLAYLALGPSARPGRQNRTRASGGELVSWLVWRQGRAGGDH